MDKVTFTSAVELAKFLAQLTREGITYEVLTRADDEWDVYLKGF